MSKSRASKMNGYSAKLSGLKPDKLKFSNKKVPTGNNPVRHTENNVQINFITIEENAQWKD